MRFIIIKNNFLLHTIKKIILCLCIYLSIYFNFHNFRLNFNEKWIFMVISFAFMGLQNLSQVIINILIESITIEIRFI
jgi:hypothetical protein